MSVPSSAIYMLGYEYLLSVLAPMFANKGQNAILTPAPLVAGSLARTLSATIISPIEMFRTRLQALPPREFTARAVPHKTTRWSCGKGCCS